MDISDRILRSLTTVRLMFDARGYTNLRGPTKMKVNKLYIIELTADYINPRNNNNERVTCVWIPFNSLKLNSTVGKQDIQDFCNSTSSSDHLIFITDSISFQAVAFLGSISSYWEVLSYDDTACAKMDHVYVPKYELLTENEILVYEKKFGNRKTFNKMISKVDALARFMDYRPGDVVRFDKISCIGGLSEGLRLVIDETDVL
jgi:DNA-directed RNA polymerase subunit H (RpoH/RPB5)